ncbi:hypothetical protein SAMN04487906_0191 [Zhouia amylolytica]|uniref:Uncharacterized protein n=1 Tax=Zhouia amylolytica TaxID=376730 RepID=A0A1I6PA22_9FLAO|nr:hypothetical protein [Zhouia amylolytica]MCQ0113055.1 hypothetical protein [Zhouia amylolytica]SFS37062.1 hypothetical protein SAMN04487906_0191 [Zhouia amylolytica]
MKKAFGFKVAVNDQLICRAGFENEHSIVTCILDSVRRKNENSEELSIHISGLNSDTNHQVDWFKDSLKEGDKISIEVISNGFDPPATERKAFKDKDLIAHKLKTYYKLKEELKEHLNE